MSDCQSVRAGVLVRELGELERDPILAAHLTSCARCSAELALVRLATAATADMLNEQLPSAHAAELARTAIDRAASWHEARARIWRRASLALPALATAVWVIAVSDRAAPFRSAIGFPDPPYVTTIALQCLSGSDAAGVAGPYLRSGGGTALPGPEGVPSVTLTGERAEVAEAEIAIAKLDGRLGPAAAGACRR